MDQIGDVLKKHQNKYFQLLSSSLSMKNLYFMAIFACLVENCLNISSESTDDSNETDSDNSLFVNKDVTLRDITQKHGKFGKGYLLYQTYETKNHATDVYRLKERGSESTDDSNLNETDSSESSQDKSLQAYSMSSHRNGNRLLNKVVTSRKNMTTRKYGSLRKGYSKSYKMKNDACDACRLKRHRARNFESKNDSNVNETESVNRLLVNKVITSNKSTRIITGKYDRLGEGYSKSYQMRNYTTDDNVIFNTAPVKDFKRTENSWNKPLRSSVLIDEDFTVKPISRDYEIQKQQKNYFTSSVRDYEYYDASNNRHDKKYVNHYAEPSIIIQVENSQNPELSYNNTELYHNKKSKNNYVINFTTPRLKPDFTVTLVDNNVIFNTAPVKDFKRTENIWNKPLRSSILLIDEDFTEKPINRDYTTQKQQTNDFTASVRHYDGSNNRYNKKYVNHNTDINDQDDNSQNLEYYYEKSKENYVINFTAARLEPNFTVKSNRHVERVIGEKNTDNKENVIVYKSKEKNSDNFMFEIKLKHFSKLNNSLDGSINFRINENANTTNGDSIRDKIKLHVGIASTAGQKNSFKRDSFNNHELLVRQTTKNDNYELDRNKNEMVTENSVIHAHYKQLLNELTANDDVIDTSLSRDGNMQYYENNDDLDYRSKSKQNVDMHKHNKKIYDYNSIFEMKSNGRRSWNHTNNYKGIQADRKPVKVLNRRKRNRQDPKFTREYRLNLNAPHRFKVLRRDCITNRFDKKGLYNKECGNIHGNLVKDIEDEIVNDLQTTLNLNINNAYPEDLNSRRKRTERSSKTTTRRTKKTSKTTTKHLIDIMKVIRHIQRINGITVRGDAMEFGDAATTDSQTDKTTFDDTITTTPIPETQAATLDINEAIQQLMVRKIDNITNYIMKRMIKKLQKDKKYNSVERFDIILDARELRSKRPPKVLDGRLLRPTVTH